MAKRLGVLGAAIALVALAVGVVSPALGSSGDDDKQRTIRVVAVNTDFAELDLGEEGFSLGDGWVFAHKFLKGGKEVGHVGGQCTSVSVEYEEPQCVVTASFRGGQITAQTLISPGHGDIVQAITGGTGKYTGAEGELIIRGTSPTSETWTFVLED